MDEFDDNCELCREFLSGQCHHLPSVGRRLLYNDDEFVVFPALGSFVDGYLIISPKAHVLSCASLASNVLTKLQNLIDAVGQIVEQEYGPFIILEHGMASCYIRAGGCIDHAHLQLIPGVADLFPVFAEHFQTEVLKDWSDLANWKERPYNLFQSSSGQIYICEVPNYLPSQFLRKHAARQLNCYENWDWRNHMGIEAIHRTICKLTEPLKTMSARIYSPN